MRVDKVQEQRTVFGMKRIASLRDWALKHPEKRIEIPSEKLAKCNESIKAALKYLKKERAAAEQSASQIFLIK